MMIQQVEIEEALSSRGPTDRTTVVGKNGVEIVPHLTLTLIYTKQGGLWEDNQDQELLLACCMFYECLAHFCCPSEVHLMEHIFKFY